MTYTITSLFSEDCITGLGVGAGATVGMGVGAGVGARVGIGVGSMVGTGVGFIVGIGEGVTGVAVAKTVVLLSGVTKGVLLAVGLQAVKSISTSDINMPRSLIIYRLLFFSILYLNI